jgi:hypothetical protein
MKRLILLLATIFLVSMSMYAQQKELLIRCDDSGMSHATNTALQQLAETGIPFSTSIMFACPWYQESVQVLKKYDHISAGIHLTLNAEWKNYRWGPVAGVDSVPSLVDSTGFFVGSRAAFDALEPELAHIEKELRAQIERSLSSGIRIDYIDYHMGTAVDKPERRALVERLAKEYNLAVSRYYGEEDVEGMYSVPISEKKTHLLNVVTTLKEGSPQLLVSHIISDTPEVQALEDMNSFGLKKMSKHRFAELEALMSLDFRKALEEHGVRLITYKDLRDRAGLGKLEER